MDLIDALRLDQPDILGWSLGGFIALTVVINYPDMLNRVVVADTSSGGEEGDQTYPGCHRLWLWLLNASDSSEMQQSCVPLTILTCSTPVCL